MIKGPAFMQLLVEGNSFECVFITYHDVSHSNIECVDMMIAEGCQINGKDKLGRYI